MVLRQGAGGEGGKSGGAVVVVEGEGAASLLGHCVPWLSIFRFRLSFQSREEEVVARSRASVSDIEQSKPVKQ